MADQITVKVHNFTKDYIDEIISNLKKAGFSFESEKALYSVAVLRLKSESDNVNWNNKKSVNEFLEGLLNDLYYLEETKIVKTKMRGFPKIES